MKGRDGCIEWIFYVGAKRKIQNLFLKLTHYFGANATSRCAYANYGDAIGKPDFFKVKMRNFI